MISPLPAGVADQVRSTVLDGPQALRRDWFDSGGGVLVPVEDFTGLPGPEGERFAAAVRSSAASAVWGLFTEAGFNTMLNEEDGVILPIDHEVIHEWAGSRAMFNLMLITPDLSFALLEANDEFGLVGGPREAVETFLGTSVEQAHQDFTKYAEYSKEASRHLPGIARLYPPNLG